MSPLQIHNTLTNKIEEFVPLNGNKVLVYACGPTVYDLSHLGHARVYIIWDFVQRYLRFLGYDVTFVRNITDVDDKIINRAKEKGVAPEKLARENIYNFWHDMRLLNIQPPDVEPRATEFIKPMQDFIAKLIEKKHAYVSEGSHGDVYFDVASFKEYGKLGKQTLEKLLVGAREQVRSQEDLSTHKRSPVDFALWKAAKEDEPGWPSPWGHGRPGWHLECSTMIEQVLGTTIDIHGGGEDLIFPHHENEIAQSESLHGKPLARYWMHNSFVQLNAEKMSKSLGNIESIRGLLESFSADAIRLFILQTHYRSPIDFSFESLTAAKNGLMRLVRAAHADNGEVHGYSNGSSKKDDSVIAAFKTEFTEAMNSDFNTAVAISKLFALSEEVNKAVSQKDKEKISAYAQTLRQYAGILGFTLRDSRGELDKQTIDKVMDLVLQLRNNARSNKDYATSDLIRKQLSELGINVMDIAGGGATWERT